MISLRLSVYEQDRSMSAHLQRGVREASIMALAFCILKAFTSHIFIPLTGFLTGYSIAHLAFKVMTHYNISFEPNKTLFSQVFQRYPKLKVIMLIFAVVVAGAYPYIGLALGLCVGVAIGVELLTARSFDSRDSWIKKVWTSLFSA